MTCWVLAVMRVAKPNPYDTETEPDVDCGIWPVLVCPRWPLECDTHRCQ